MNRPDLKGKNVFDTVNELVSYIIQNDVFILYDSLSPKEKVKMLTSLLPYVLSKNVSISLKSDIQDFEERIRRAFEQKK